MSQIDLNGLIKKGTVELQRSESPEETKARIEREEREYRHEQTKSFILFLVVLFGLVAIALVTSVAALLPGWFGLNAGSQAWAQGLASSVITGGIGFLKEEQLNEPRG
jgi:nitrate reductase NapE component